MGEQLNIKDAKTVRLARDLANRTGKSVTETIRLALETSARARSTERGERRHRIKKITEKIRREMPARNETATLKEVMDTIYVDGLPE